LKNLLHYIVFLSALLFGFSGARAQDSLAHKKVYALDTTTKSIDSLQKKIISKSDTLKELNKSLSRVKQKGYRTVDSLQQNFHHRTDSLQKVFTAPMNQLQLKINHLKNKKDSLEKIHLPAQSITHQMDSLTQHQAAKLKELNTHIDKVKKQTLDKAAALQLPPEAQKEISALTKNIQGYAVPNNFFSLPGMNLNALGKVPSLSLPSNVNIPTGNIPSLPNVNTSTQLPSLSQVKTPPVDEIKKLQTVQKPDEKAIEKEVMNAANQNQETKSLLKEEAQLKGMQKEVAQLRDQKKLDSLALQNLKPALNHFAGKEQELKAAMDKVSKLKQKYSDVKSIAELPKRRPNPLKGKPWFERMVPGLNYFIQNKHYTLVDFNPYVAWRFYPKLSASIGWNERIGD
jgi:hypothetical protein